MKRSTLPLVCGRRKRVRRTRIPRASQPACQRRLKQVMEQLPGPLALVADDLGPRGALVQPRAAVPARIACTVEAASRSAQPSRCGPSNELRSRPQHRLLDRRRRPPRRAAGAGGAIVEALPAAGAADPLRAGLARAAHDRGRGRDRHSPGNQRDQAQPLAAAERGVSVKNHRALLVVATPTSRTLGGLFDVTASDERQQRLWATARSRRARAPRSRLARRRPWRFRRPRACACLPRSRRARCPRGSPSGRRGARASPTS